MTQMKVTKLFMIYMIGGWFYPDISNIIRTCILRLMVVQQRGQSLEYLTTNIKKVLEVDFGEGNLDGI